MDRVDDLNQDIVKYNTYSRNLSKQQQQKHQVNSARVLIRMHAGFQEGKCPHHPHNETAGAAGTSAHQHAYIDRFTSSTFSLSHTHLQADAPTVTVSMEKQQV